MQLESTSYSNYKDRILNMKDRVILQPHEICIERAKLFSESYKKTRGESSNIRIAKALDNLLSNMTINIWEDEFIVGNQCTKFVGTPLYPEVRIDTIELDLDLYNTREVQKFQLSEQDKEIIKNEIIPFWKTQEETVKSKFDSYLSPELYDQMLNLLYIVDVNLTNGVGHFFPGYENVLKEGFNGLVHKTQIKLEKVSNDAEKENFLKSVIIVLDLLI
jgi:pyruvate-formate lyase